MKKTYTIRVALHSEAKSGECWSYDEFKNGVRLMKIRNAENGKSIIVSHRHIDSNFENYYNAPGRISLSFVDNSLVIDGYYRTRLQIEKNQKVQLEITPVAKRNVFYQLRFLKQHSNDTTRITYWLAVFAIVLSIITPFFEHLLNHYPCVLKKWGL